MNSGLPSVLSWMSAGSSLGNRCPGNSSAKYRWISDAVRDSRAIVQTPRLLHIPPQLEKRMVRELQIRGERDVTMSRTRRSANRLASNDRLKEPYEDWCHVLRRALPRRAQLTSEDVVFTFTSMMDPVFASPWRGAFRDLASIVAIDRYSVDFILKQPSGSFLPNLVFKIVPARAGRELRQRPIGTGPYALFSYAVDDRLEMRAFREEFEGLPRNLGLIDEDRSRRHHARSRAAEGHGRSPS